MQRTNFSNKYIFIYITVLVVVVAAILALASMLLQQRQNDNRKTEKMQSILHSIGIEAQTENAISLYKKYVVNELLVDASGSIVSNFSENDIPSVAFSANMKEELTKGNEGQFPIMVAKIDTNDVYVFPLQGKGLWGPIWGFIALKSDMSTIVGINLDHKGETPGLGAQIATIAFQQQFKGKKIYDDNGNFMSITLVKGGEGNFSGDRSHAVDAISGGTLTSNGVTEMLFDCLRMYEPYMKKMLNLEPVAVDTVSVQDIVVREYTYYRRDTAEVGEKISSTSQSLQGEFSEPSAPKHAETLNVAPKQVETPAPAPIKQEEVVAPTPEQPVAEPAAASEEVDMSTPDKNKKKKRGKNSKNDNETINGTED